MTVETGFGKVEGVEDSGIVRWLGIPFAEPPVGALRYKRARECKPWGGVLKADSFGPRPCQFMDNRSVRRLECSEDCLYLNIWAPKTAEKAPVFIYYYGGANATGEASSPMYDGTSFAENGVIYVIFNYRLGPLGFYDFSVYDDSFESNCGFSDQIAGLRWVKENIAEFGGDPDNITICGESAGGTAVYDLLAAPSAKGLFRKAIAMSGLADDAVSQHHNRLNMDLFLDKMRIDIKNIQVLKTIEPSKMIEAAGWMFQNNNTVYPGIFVPGPVLDDLLPEKPWEAMARGSANGIDCIFGTCRDEATFFSLIKVLPRSWQDVARMLELSGCPGKFADLKRLYSGMNEKKAMNELFRDRLFWAHYVLCADAQSSFGNVYAYRFDFIYTFLKLTGLGAMHGSDVGAALNTTKGTLNKFAAGTPKKKKELLRSRMHGAWISFAKNGTPDENLAIEWPSYDPAGRATMIIDDEWKVELNPRPEAFETWKDIELYK